ncbi:MAG: DegV family protein [Peptococcaceae bacterium]|nr:DegV family protein [Peptococcaceae bacterium]
MRKVKVIADSTNDLSFEILQQYDIDVVPLYVEFGEETYKDGVDIIPEQLFQLVSEKGILPKTAAPSPFDFISVYTKYIEEGMDILVITLSAKMSSTYQNAVLAASEFPKGRIRVIDSQNLTTGIGSLVMIAREMAEKGIEIHSIAQELEALVTKVKVSFVIDTLEYLYKGGRCNVIQNLLGTALKIRPIIAVEDGRMIVEDKVRGDKKRAIEKLLEKLFKNPQSIYQNRIIIPYSLGSEEDAELMKSMIQKELPGTEILITKAGCVISSHCGMKTLGLSYIQK